MNVLRIYSFKMNANYVYNEPYLYHKNKCFEYPEENCKGISIFFFHARTITLTLEYQASVLFLSTCLRFLATQKNKYTCREYIMHATLTLQNIPNIVISFKCSTVVTINV